jgi:hypothetical protein
VTRRPVNTWAADTNPPEPLAAGRLQPAAFCNEPAETGRGSQRDASATAASSWAKTPAFAKLLGAARGTALFYETLWIEGPRVLEMRSILVH